MGCGASVPCTLQFGPTPPEKHFLTHAVEAECIDGSCDTQPKLGTESPSIGDESIPSSSSTTEPSNSENRFGFPEIEISTMARIVLLTWVRAGRTKRRGQTETHKEFGNSKPRVPSKYKPRPRQCAPLRSIPRKCPPLRPISVQATPCQTPRREDPLPDEEDMPSLLYALQAHKDEEKVNHGERRSSRTLPTGFFDELRGVQVRAMQSQSMRHQLRRSLPEEVGRANTISQKTPGFGQETPNFPLQATDSSRLASGQQTAAIDCAMSPWMFASIEDEGQLPLELLDCIDELNSFPKTAFNLCLKEREDPMSSEPLNSCDHDELVHASTTLAIEAQDVSKPAPAMPTCDSKVGVYPVGSLVSYFSKSRMGWMKGVIMQIMDGLYLVDKGFGCCGKCGWAEIMNEADRKLHVYRLIDILDGKPFRIRPSGRPVVRTDISSDEDEPG